MSERTEAAWMAAYALGLAVSPGDGDGCADALVEAAAGRHEVIAGARADLQRLQRGDVTAYRRAVDLLDRAERRLTPPDGRQLHPVS